MNDIPEGYKRCSRGDNCVHPEGPVLPATTEYFAIHKKQNGGLQTYCKACQREYRQQHKEEISQRQREYQQQHKEGISQYQHKYRKMHRDRIKQRKRQYHQDHKEEIREYRQQNKERIKQRRHDWHYANREDQNRKSREYANSHKESRRLYRKRYQEQNQDALREYSRQYRKKHAEKVRIHIRNRSALRRSLPNTLTLMEWESALRYFNGCCAVCGRPPGLWHTLAADHWIPLTAANCPGTVATNIIPLCHSQKDGEGGCNTSKSNKDAAQWLVERFGKRKAKQILERIEAYFEWVKKQGGE